MSTQFKEQDYNTDTLDTALWKRIFSLFWEHRSHLFILFSMMVLIALMDVLFPLLHKYAIDEYVVNQRPFELYSWFSAAYLGMVFIQGFAVYFFIRQGGKVEMDFAYSVRQKAFDKLQRLSFSYYDKTPLGWIMARMTSDIPRLADIISWSLIDFFWGSALMLGLSIVMLILNWKLALLVLFTVPILAVISVKFQRMILEKHRETRKINSKITGAFSEGITGAKTTKTLVIEENQSREFKELSSSMREHSIEAAILSAVFMPLVMGLGAVASSLLLWKGGEAVLWGTLEFGTLVLFSQYAGQFFEPLRQIARLLAEFQMAQASAERVLSLLDAEIDVTDHEQVIQHYGDLLDPTIHHNEAIVGNVEFKSVDFFYKPEEPVLTQFSLKVKAGESVAIVGETGSGKSTLVNLICRFYEPQKGEIFIDGINLQDRSLGWLHSKLGYVLQSPHLFSGTVMENIRYGRLEASDDEIMEAAKQVSAHEFILDLENGYQTEVGEGGNKLSTGQKQLVSFARAILAKPSLFILDEATSSIDTETEQLIQKAIGSILKGRTSFVIAHRLSTIVQSDRILVMRNGRIVEEGKHHELLALKGYYHRLYTHQFNQEQQEALWGVKEENHEDELNRMFTETEDA